MTGLWVRLVRKNRIMRDVTVPCDREAWQEALEEACKMLDVPRPLLLPAHERDFEAFSQTRFLKDHFVEEVPFDRMETEWISPQAKKKVNEAYL